MKKQHYKITKLIHWDKEMPYMDVLDIDRDTLDLMDDIVMIDGCVVVDFIQEQECDNNFFIVMSGNGNTHHWYYDRLERENPMVRLYD